MDLEAGNAKYSVINFYSGLELFLKARLLKEHWTLCAADVGQVEKSKFTAGDIVTVGLDEAGNRLAKIVGSPLSKDEMRVYNKLRMRRNQAVHFYHPNDLSSRTKVAVEQLSGWHFLHKRLTSTWSDCFEPYSHRLTRAHQTISRREDYFPTIFEEFKDEICKQTKKKPWSDCCFCRQPSAVTIGEVVRDVHRLVCLVCSTEEFVVYLPCTGCHKPAARSFKKAMICQWCGHEHKANVTESFRRATEVLSDLSLVAWCGECGYTVEQSVTRVGESSLCLACYSFDERADINLCPWCGDKVTGRVGTNLEPGCIRCQYYLEHGDDEAAAPEYLNDPTIDKGDDHGG